MNHEAQFAAILTPLAPGAIGTVGVIGKGVPIALSMILCRRDGSVLEDIPENRPILCRVMDGGETLDDAIVVLSRRDSPVGSSHESHWLAELNVHGGVRVVQRVLALLEQHGVTRVESGSFLAMTNECHGVELDTQWALMRAGSRRVAEWLLAQRAVLPDYLLRLPALGASEQSSFRRRTETAIRLLAGMRVAIAGPPNAGKSTLANRLIGHDRIITSDTPGTTRDWVSETALIRGWPVTLTDTAGIRETDCEIESEAIRRGQRQAALADLVVMVFDAVAPSRGQSFDTVFQKAHQENQPIIVVWNKCDRLDGAPNDEAVKNGIRVSALTGTGIEVLESEILRLLGLEQLQSNLPTGFSEAHLANLRHSNSPDN